MKTVVSVSQGSSEYDYELETEFLGHTFRVVRVGTDGNLDRAEAVLDSIRAQADAIGLSMIHDHYQVGREQLEHPDTARLEACVPDKPITTGAGLRGILQEWAVRHTQTELGHFFDNARVLFLNGQAGFRIARALSEHTDNLFFADPYLDFGVPRLLNSLNQLEAYTKLTAPVMFSPNAVRVIERLHRSPLYRMGEKLISGSLHKAVKDCHVIVGAMGDLEVFSEKELDGKTVITSRVTTSALDWFRSRRVAMVVDYSPWLAGRPVGVNVMEAMISAALSRTPEQLGADDFLDVIEQLGVEPRILYPNGYRRINRFAFVIHPLSQQYLTKTPPLDWVASVSPPAVMNLVEKAIAYTPPFVYSKVSGIQSPTGDEVEGWLITVGGTPREIMDHDPEFTYSRLLAAANLAKKLGAQIMGLGAFTKVVGDAGITVAKRAPLPITTGNSYSASGALWAAHDAAKRIGRVSIGKSGKMAGKAMVVGATGAIGSVCARLLAKAVDEIYLVAPEAAKLLSLKESIEQETPGAIVHVAATTNRDLGDMDMVVTATSGAGKRILDIMQVKPGCVITDVARPLDIPAEDVAKRPDVLVIESGEIKLPGIVKMKDIGLPKGIAYACLAETIVLALEARFENFTLGRNIEWEKVREIYKLGLKHGMELAAVSGVNGVFTEEDFERVRTLAAHVTEPA
ncbi:MULTISPECIES: dehydrogenase [unclassified Marinobacter]|uniref:dehydrogenase n=1 Tax=unclassified Marinobacter TaxID=83889 RepID=UPI001267B3D3|nr:MULTISPECIES: dehydrogenase [unclassified Marinobacter]QFS87350.1 Long-chain acyl-[acyl-carrier-protein] reductase [Marinobacter sp. THAF197a]QFT51134.1 Long-chain acyl-[acyl-carrier-protein] reductase [Marinobacter sp. THAF39]